MKMKKILCAILSATLLASSAIPVLAVENKDSTQDATILTEGTYAPNQAVVLFRDSAIDTGSTTKNATFNPSGRISARCRALHHQKTNRFRQQMRK